MILRPQLFRPQLGMSLVEVLVTVVLISVGLLGVAALHISSLRSNQESYARSQAATLAADILDRMRANQIGLAQYEVAFNATGTAGTTAGMDLASWQATIDQLLPGGAANAAGQIDIDNTNTRVVTVTIQWSERAEAANARTRLNQADLSTFVTRSEI